jgi:hypothetical protein
MTPYMPHNKRTTLNAGNITVANLKITISIFTAPNTTSSNHLYNTLELLMMGIMVPETCWARNKIFNKKKLSVASSWHFISTYYRWCTVKTTSNCYVLPTLVSRYIYTIFIRILTRGYSYRQHRDISKASTIPTQKSTLLHVCRSSHKYSKRPA